MGDVKKVFRPDELEGLDENKKQRLQQELTKQIQASKEIQAIIKKHDEEPHVRAVVDLHDVANESLREKLDDTLKQLKSE